MFKMANKKLLPVLLLILSLFINLFSGYHTTHAASYDGEVSVYSLNVRAEPSTDSTILGKLTYKEKVKINNVQDNWGELTYKNKKGYVFIKYIDLINSTSTEKQMTPTVSVLNVRDGASTNNKVLGKLITGDVVTIVSEQGKWGYYLKSNVRHYVYLPYMKKVAAADTQKTIDSNLLKKAKITATSLNIRTAPNTNSNILGKLKKDEVVVYGVVNSKWGEIVYNNKKGYINLSYLSDIKNIKKMVPNVTTTLNVRELPTINSNALGTISNKDVFDVELIYAKWGKINFNGKVAYVYLEYMKDYAPNSSTPPSSDTLPVVEKIGTVEATFLNVRSGPGTFHDALGTLKYGEKITVLQVTGDWARFIYNGKDAYIHTGYLLIEDKQTYTPPPPVQPPSEVVKTGYVTATNLNVRKEASTSAAILGVLTHGSKVEVVSENNGWGKIKYNGTYGFVSMSYISFNAPTQPVVGYANLKDKVIVIDAGHGGKDTGAIGNSMYEKDIVLDVAKKLKTKLETNGAKVIMTRTDDTYLELSQRTSISNNSNAVAFISIHVNSSTYTSATGVETYYHASTNTTLKNKSLNLANSIHKELLTTSDMPNRKVKTANFQVIKYNTKPSVLLELGFISNSHNANYLKDQTFRNKTADAITKGLSEYFKTN